MNIEGVNITEYDIGKEVTYNRIFDIIDSGVITSYNDTYVFVRYKGDSTSQATKPDDLYWNDREEEFKLKCSVITTLDIEGILTMTNFRYELEGSNISPTFYYLHLYKNEVKFGTVELTKTNKLHRIFNVSDEEKLIIKRNLQIDNLV